jgi:phytanoyl-CoA hydroxylase
MNLPQVVEDYERDGVVRIRQFLPPTQVHEVRREIAKYVDEIAPTLAPTEVVFEADEKTPRNLWRMEKHSAYFAGLAKKPKIISLVSQLVHGDPVLLGVETFNKPSRIGSGVPPHQDNAYFCQAPPDVLTVWIAMDPATEGNGPVQYARGSHKLGLLPHEASGVKGNSIRLAGQFDHSDIFVGLLRPGDALIHHCETVHYSTPNHTEWPRCGFLLVYRGAHTQTDPVLKATYDEARALVV